ncbi:Gamma-aminobutyric acid receptor subunit alpha-4-like protein, partial [Dinothrombium tinctorium]
NVIIGGGETLYTFHQIVVRSPYDKYVRPAIDGEAVRVNLSIHINDIEISKETKEYLYLDITLDFQQLWNDPRLIYEVYLSTTPRILLGKYEFFQLIWKPDTFISNAYNLKNFSNPPLFIRIQQNGNVFFSER